MAQDNIDPPDYPRESGVGTIMAVLLVLVLVAFLVWALAFGGFSALTGESSVPATGGAAPTVQANPGGAGTTAPARGSTAPTSGATGSPAPARP